MWWEYLSWDSATHVWLSQCSTESAWRYNLFSGFRGSCKSTGISLSAHRMCVQSLGLGHIFPNCIFPQSVHQNRLLYRLWGKWKWPLVRDNNWSNTVICRNKAIRHKGREVLTLQKLKGRNCEHEKWGKILKEGQAVLEEGADVLLVLDMGWTSWLGAWKCVSRKHRKKQKSAKVDKRDSSIAIRKKRVKRLHFSRDRFWQRVRTRWSLKSLWTQTILWLSGSMMIRACLPHKSRRKLWILTLSVRTIIKNIGKTASLYTGHWWR